MQLSIKQTKSRRSRIGLAEYAIELPMEIVDRGSFVECTLVSRLNRHGAKETLTPGLPRKGEESSSFKLRKLIDFQDLNPAQLYDSIPKITFYCALNEVIRTLMRERWDGTKGTCIDCKKVSRRVEQLYHEERFTHRLTESGYLTIV